MQGVSRSQILVKERFEYNETVVIIGDTGNTCRILDQIFVVANGHDFYACNVFEFCKSSMLQIEL